MIPVTLSLWKLTPKSKRWAAEEIASTYVYPTFLLYMPTCNLQKVEKQGSILHEDGDENWASRYKAETKQL